MPATPRPAVIAPEPLKLTGCTGVRLRSMTRVVTRHYDAHLAQAGLRLTQYSLMAALKSLSPAPHSALARQLGMDRTTLTRNLKPLVEAGWVSQTREAHDARTTVLRLTDEGLALLQRARPLWRSAQTSLNQLLGAERVSTLHALLDDSMAVLGDDAPAAASR